MAGNMELPPSLEKGSDLRSECELGSCTKIWVPRVLVEEADWGVRGKNVRGEEGRLVCTDALTQHNNT